MSAIFKREFKAYFLAPIGYIYLAVMYFFLGFYFWLTFSQGSSEIPQVIYYMATVALFVVPVLTMRTLSEDRRQKVDQVLLTAPVKLSSIIFGKFFAALAVFAIGFAPSVLFEMIVASYVSINVFSYIYMLIGMLLFGATLIALGMFISSLTESTALSAISTLIANLFILFMPSLASTIGSSNTGNTKFFAWIVSGIQKLCETLSLNETLMRFYEEVLSFRDVVYLLSFTAVFIFLSIRSLDKRRWA